jgi:hypothetical protein
VYAYSTLMALIDAGWFEVPYPDTEETPVPEGWPSVACSRAQYLAVERAAFQPFLSMHLGGGAPQAGD